MYELFITNCWFSVMKIREKEKREKQPQFFVNKRKVRIKTKLCPNYASHSEIDFTNSFHVTFST